jgi:CRP-like cAMP-binding protein
MDREAAAKFMAATGWLGRQPEDFRTEVLRRSLYRRHGAGKVLYDIGDPPGGVFGLVAGTIEMQLPNGHIGTVATPGFWVGEASAFRRETKRVALVAKSPVSVFYLPLIEFERLITNPDHCRCFAILTIEHLENALRVVASLMPNDAVARVASRLQSLMIADSRGGRDLTVTQGDLASMCGLSRQTVNRALRRLADLGAIAAHYGTVSVVDPERLRGLASGPEERDLADGAPGPGPAG